MHIACQMRSFQPTVLEKAEVSAEDAVALVNGPPVMIEFTLSVLARTSLSGRDIYTSLGIT